MNTNWVKDYSFQIVAPPKYPLLNSSLNFFLTISSIVSVGMIGPLWMSLFGAKTRFGGSIAAQPKWFFPLLIFTLSIFLGAIAIKLYRRFVPLDSRIKVLGKLNLSDAGMQLISDSKTQDIPWTNIKRLNVYVSRGMGGGFEDDSMDWIRKAEALRLTIIHLKGNIEVHVQNKTQSEEDNIFLFDLLNLIKNRSTNNFQKIQFWDKV
ncbi:MAG: hypothetical protein MRZ79_06990 [Bacteroidia bacterium]|nr:hypothetical protein [Bacteroidia bacterium]